MKKTKETKEVCCDVKKAKVPGISSGIYFFGFIGAAIYFIQTSSTFWMGVLGFLKALVWPVFLVYELLRFLGL